MKRLVVSLLASFALTLVIVGCKGTGGDKPNQAAAFFSDTTKDIGIRLHRAELDGFISNADEDRLINLLIESNQLLLIGTNTIPASIDVCEPDDTPLACRGKILAAIEEALYNVDKQRGAVP